MRNGDTVALTQVEEYGERPAVDYRWENEDMNTPAVLQALLDRAAEETEPEDVVTVYLPAVTYDRPLHVRRDMNLIGDGTVIAGGLVVEPLAYGDDKEVCVNVRDVTFAGDGGVGLQVMGPTWVRGCRFTGWDVAAQALDGGWICSQENTYDSNGVALELDSGSAMLCGSDMNNSRFLRNGVAIRVKRLPVEWMTLELYDCSFTATPWIWTTRRDWSSGGRRKTPRLPAARRTGNGAALLPYITGHRGKSGIEGTARRKETEYAGRWDGKPPEDGFYYVYNTDQSAGALSLGEFQAYTYDGFRKLKAKLLTGEDIAPVCEQNREAQGLYAMASIRDEAGRSHGYMAVVLSMDVTIQAERDFLTHIICVLLLITAVLAVLSHPDGAAYPHQAGEPADGCGGEALCSGAGRLRRTSVSHRRPPAGTTAFMGQSECWRL